MCLAHSKYTNSCYVRHLQSTIINTVLQNSDFCIIIIVVLGVQTKVFTIYHSWIHSSTILHYPSYPHYWNSFIRSRFSTWKLLPGLRGVLECRIEGHEFSFLPQDLVSQDRMISDGHSFSNQILSLHNEVISPVWDGPTTYFPLQSVFVCLAHLSKPLSFPHSVCLIPFCHVYCFISGFLNVLCFIFLMESELGSLSRGWKWKVWNPQVSQWAAAPQGSPQWGWTGTGTVMVKGEAAILPAMDHALLLFPNDLKFKFKWCIARLGSFCFRREGCFKICRKFVNLMWEKQGKIINRLSLHHPNFITVTFWHLFWYQHFGYFFNVKYIFVCI
jgi:hypothetical protein